MLTPQVASVPCGDLGPIAGELTSERDAIAAALNILVTGI